MVPLAMVVGAPRLLLAEWTAPVTALVVTLLIEETLRVPLLSDTTVPLKVLAPVNSKVVPLAP